MNETTKIRVDKWLWAVRFFKTRTLAAEACDGGKIKLDGKNLKPAYGIKIGDTLLITKENERLTIQVTQLIEKRVGAEIAQTCYNNLTPTQDKNLNPDAPLSPSFYNAFATPKRTRGTGRPTKKDRRYLDDFYDAEQPNLDLNDVEEEGLS